MNVIREIKMVIVFAFASFVLGSLMVLCNILISIHNAKNRFKKIDRHSSLIPVLDTIFFAVGIFFLCSKTLSFLPLIATLVGLFLILQLVYYLAFRITLSMMGECGST